MMYVEIPGNTRFNEKEAVAMTGTEFSWGIKLNVDEDHLDAHNYESFKQDFLTHAGSNKKVLLSMLGVEFVDSAGLGAIMSMMRQLREKGCDLFLCAPEKSVEMLFEMVRLHQVVTIFHDEKEAVKELANAV